MGKQWARQEIKKNEVAEVLGQATDWTTANPRQVQAIAAGVLGAVFIAALIGWRTVQNRNEAWKELLLAQTMAYQGHPDMAVEQLKAFSAKYPNPVAAGFGTLFSGDILYRVGKYKEAAQAYQNLVDQQSPKAVMPFALNALGIAQEAAGDCKSAADTDQRFLDAYADHFLAPQAHASLARCLDLMGQKDKAKATYERMSLMYPDSYWAQWAQAKLKSS